MGLFDHSEGFGNDVGRGFAAPFVWIYRKGEKVDNLLDKGLDAGGNVLDGIGNLFSGNTLYWVAGVAVVAIIIIKKA
jgi:hypothetical protein